MISFVDEYIFDFEYKPGNKNLLADALLRGPDYELAHVTNLSSLVAELFPKVYAKDKHGVFMLRTLGSEEFTDSDIELSSRLRARLH